MSSDTPQHPAPSVSGPTSKKGKVKKTTDPLETSKLLAAKISQLESDKAGERDIEAEIGGCHLPSAHAFASYYEYHFYSSGSLLVNSKARRGSELL